jgi:hypothetical protein
MIRDYEKSERISGYDLIPVEPVLLFSAKHFLNK